MKPISKLGIGPMSQEIIEAVYRYSENNSEPLMLIASKNQIDWSGGYVNDWTTRQFAEYCNVLKKKYPKAKVYLCRDHCGPGFKNDDINDVYKTINDDLDNGFEVIHIDFCHYKGVYEERLAESKKAIEHILKKKPGTIIEIGTDENKGDFLTNIKIPPSTNHSSFNGRFHKPNIGSLFRSSCDNGFKHIVEAMT